MQTYLWVDLETTGLDPDIHTITEIAMIVTKGPETGFGEIDRYESVIAVPGSVPWSLPALRMAEESGLFEELEAGKGSPMERVVVEAVRMILKYDRPILASRNTSFERSFLKKYLLPLEELLHYREFDVTPLRLIDPLPFTNNDPGTPHRAMYDIERDLNGARAFVEAYNSACGKGAE